MDRFSKLSLIHSAETCNKVVIKDPTIPDALMRITTLTKYKFSKFAPTAVTADHACKP